MTPPLCGRLAVPFALIVALFNVGLSVSAGWRPAAWIAGSILTVVAVIFAFGPAIQPRRPSLENPFALEWLRGPSVWVNDSFWIYLLLLDLGVASVVTRARRAEACVPVARDQRA